PGMSKKSFFRLCHDNNPDLAQYLISIGKPGIAISPHSEIKPEMAAKTPMLYDEREKHWKGFRNWQKHISKKKHLVYFDRIGANAGVRTDAYNVADQDIRNPSMADAFEQTIKQVCGPAPVKYRDNSTRRSLMYKLVLKDGEQPIRKWSLKWRDDDGNIEAFEWLGKGQQTVLPATH